MPGKSVDGEAVFFKRVAVVKTEKNSRYQPVDRKYGRTTILGLLPSLQFSQSSSPSLAAKQ